MMTVKEVRRIRGHSYLYENHFVWDKVRKRSRREWSRYLGPCDAKGHLRSQPKVKLEGVHSAFPVGPLAAFYAQARDVRICELAEEVLGLTPGEARLLLAITLNQLTGRRSLDEIPAWIDRTPLRRWEPALPSSIARGDIENVLGKLCRRVKDDGFDNLGLLLQARLTREGPRERPGAFYDVTKVGYTGTHCPVAQFGLDSDHEISRVIGFGLVVSRVRHRPMLCRLLPGATNDVRTVEETLSILKEMSGTGRMSFGGMALSMDRGMVSVPNLRRVVRAGYHQVGMVKGWPKGAWAYAGRWSGEALQKPEFTLCREGGTPLYGRAFIGELYEEKVRLRLVLMEDPARKAEERRARDLALEEWKGRTTDARRKELTRALKDVLVEAKGRRGWKVDAGKVEEQRVRDGRFLLFSTDAKMEAREIFDLWSQRGAIESVFRTSKGELMLGPPRMRRPDRLEAYATVVYLALLLWSDAEWRLRQKFPKETMVSAVRTLGDVYWVRLGTKERTRDWATVLSDEQKELMDALGGLPYLPHP